MFWRKDSEEQASFWIATAELPKTAANSFYHRLDRTLADSGFGDAVRALCASFYETDRSRGGRPSIDPEVCRWWVSSRACRASGRLLCGVRTPCRSVNSCTTGLAMGLDFGRNRMTSHAQLRLTPFHGRVSASSA